MRPSRVVLAFFNRLFRLSKITRLVVLLCLLLSTNIHLYSSFEPKLKYNSNPSLSKSGVGIPIVSVNANYTIDESSVTTLDIIVSLDIAGTLDATVDLTVINQTAIFGTDMTGTIPTQLTFLAGETTKTISLTVVNDDIYEPEALGYEYFEIQLSNFVNLDNVSNITSEIRIYDDDPLPEISVVRGTGMEGYFMFVYGDLSNPCDEEVTFTYLTIDDTALDHVDYLGNSSPLTFTVDPLATIFNLTFFLINDGIADDGEHFDVVVDNFVNCDSKKSKPITVRCTIQDGEVFPNLSIGNGSGNEGTSIGFYAELSQTHSKDVEFLYQTVSQTATGGLDYTEVISPITVTVPAGTIGTIFYISALTDSKEENTETFKLTFELVTKDVTLFNSSAQGTIIDINQTPVANNDYFITPQYPTVLYGDVKTNDIGIGELPITFTLLSDVSHGVLVFNSDGTFNYTPNVGFSSIDQFQYKVQDGDGDISLALVDIKMGQNDIPVPSDDNPAAINERTCPLYHQLVGNVMTNDTGLADNAYAILYTNVSNGTLVFNSDGSYTYDPDPNFFGTETFQYRLNDINEDLSVVATVTITVYYYNDGPPVANNDVVSTNVNTSVVIPVLDNDTHVDGCLTIDKSSIIIIDNTLHGTLSINTTTGVVNYDPVVDYVGSDSFTYTVNDLSINGSDVKTSNIATVNITVTVFNNFPIALSKNITVELDNNGEAILLPSDIDNGSFDPDGTISAYYVNGVSSLDLTCDDKGTRTYRLKVVDNLSAFAESDATVTIVDVSDPVSIRCPSDINANAISPATTAVVSYETPLFTDNCDGSNMAGTRIQGLASGTYFPIGATTVEYKYTDTSGNLSASCLFVVTVVQVNNPPVITCHEDVTVIANFVGNVYKVPDTSLDATATDVDGIASIIHDYNGGGSTLQDSIFVPGIYTVQWVATDNASVTSNCSFQLTVLPITISLECNKVDYTICAGEEIVFTASVTNVSGSEVINFYVDDILQSEGVSGNTFTSSTLTNGQVIKAEVVDGLVSVFRNHITVIVNVIPSTGMVYFVSNTWSEN